MGNRHKVSMIADRRGAVAFEMPFVTLFILLSFIVPIADFSIMGYDAITAYQALRDAGQYLQYHPPDDVTVAYTLPASVATIKGYQISNPTITCGTGSCSANPSALPKYYTFQTSFTLAPTSLMKPILCTSGNSNPCTYTMTYSERFQ